ncbi:MAG TPA: ParB/RepB/Spo0J family partition protein [Gemmatimonas sp.]|nr:ParB/RepB/Spo0J family partition protein [Gemmatimonas sp.]
MAPPESPRRLGRGLDALLARKDSKTGAKAGSPGDVKEIAKGKRDEARDLADDAPVSALQSIPVSKIRPNPFQPRREFRPEDLADLEASLRVNGLLQPISVRPAPTGDGYELIAGERRFRAASRLGWTEIAAVVRETDDRAALTLAMVENLQRADLDPIEEADGYQRLIDEFALSQQEVADVVGKERSTVANALRLRGLPPTVREMLQKKELAAGHARAMLPLANERAMIDLAREIADTGMSVRDVERRVQAGRAEPAKTGRRKGVAKGDESAAAAAKASAQFSSAEGRRIEELLRKRLQTAVSLHLSARDRGEVRIAFFSHDDLERVLAFLGVDTEN